MAAKAGAKASTQGLLKAMIPSLKCYYELLANKKKNNQNLTQSPPPPPPPTIKSTKPFSRLPTPDLYFLQLPLPKKPH
jgi:hypothetical protein